MSGGDLSVLDTRFHVARGPKPDDEEGVDSQIRIFQRGTKWVALLTLATPAGPISLAASADESVIAGLMAKGMKNAGSYQAKLNPEAMSAIQNSAQRIAQQVAKEGVMAKVAGMPNATKNAAAARLYTRLTQKDPTAWAAVKAIVDQAKAQNPKALEAWTLIMRVHARSRALGHEQRFTASQRAAAERIYKRLCAKDRSAWELLAQIAERAERGERPYRRAWWLIAQAHADARGGAVMGTVMGTVVGTRFGALPARAVKIAPARVNQLLALARSARTSKRRN